ncbi:uncharacterized protein ARMOST_22404 [Armillaria ostoyae]|uniref:Uncharacterized protein n=1 Tax=Armillaria ostoyae TaxID=47428 RepID=A0A284SCU1_ARMOS|nr:uncharacterized protein ARMOST_22404 [Armillaria ostoyae]
MISEPALENLVIIPVYHFCTGNIQKTQELLVMMRASPIALLSDINLIPLSYGDPYSDSTVEVWWKVLP